MHDKSFINFGLTGSFRPARRNASETKYDGSFILLHNLYRRQRIIFDWKSSVTTDFFLYGYYELFRNY